MTHEDTSNAPIATARMFGALLPAILEEDPDGIQTALRLAKRFSNDLAQWDGMTWSGPDAGYAKTAEMYRRREATGKLDIWDTIVLADLCLKASHFTALTTLESQSPKVEVFHTTVNVIEDHWRVQGTTL